MMISSNQMMMDVPPAPVARAGFQYFLKTDVEFADMGYSFLFGDKSDLGAASAK